MNEFLDVARKLKGLGETGDKTEDFNRVFAAIGKLQIVHSKSQLDLVNIESVFTAFEMAQMLQKFPGAPMKGQQHINKLIVSLKQVIVTTLEQNMIFPLRANGDIGATVPYRDLATNIRHIREIAKPAHTVSVITFNYDIAMDLALYREGMGPSYCLGTEESLPDRHVRLLKLHGSLNWTSRVRGGDVIPLHLADYFTKYNTQEGWHDPPTSTSVRIPIGSRLKKYFDEFTEEKVTGEPVIVPPTWNKATYQRSIEKVWRQAANELQDAEYIFIIGYSLPETDTFFRHLYALGTVGKMPLKRIIVFNPDTETEIKVRFKSMMGPGALSQYEYRSETFSKSLHTVKSMFPKHAR